MVYNEFVFDHHYGVEPGFIDLKNVCYTPHCSMQYYTRMRNQKVGNLIILNFAIVVIVAKSI